MRKLYMARQLRITVEGPDGDAIRDFERNIKIDPRFAQLRKEKKRFFTPALIKLIQVYNKSREKEVMKHATDLADNQKEVQSTH